MPKDQDKNFQTENRLPDKTVQKARKFVMKEKFEKARANGSWIFEIEAVSLTLNCTPEQLVEFRWFNAKKKLTVFGFEIITDVTSGKYGAIDNAISNLESAGGTMPSEEIARRNLRLNLIITENEQRRDFQNDVSEYHNLSLKEVANQLNKRTISPRLSDKNHLMTTKTFERRLRGGERLFKNYRKSAGQSDTPFVPNEMPALTAWFYREAFKNKWKPPTIVGYRSDITTWLSRQLSSRQLGLEYLALWESEAGLRGCLKIAGEDDETIAAFLSKGKDRKKLLGRIPTRTSAHREKKVVLNDFHWIRKYLLCESDNLISREVDAIILATSLTGLRPIEWQTAILTHVPDSDPELDFFELKTMNAKATGGRAPGATRTLTLKNMGAELLKSIVWATSIGCKYAEMGERTFKNFHNRCNELLQEAASYAALKQEFSKKAPKYTVYSFRHQFVANCKAQKIHWEEIAAILGQIDAYTAIEEYGKSRSGWHPDSTRGTVSPDSDSLAQVRKHTDAKAFHNARYRKIVEARPDREPPLPTMTLKPSRNFMKRNF